MQSSPTALDTIELEAIEEITQYIAARYDAPAIFAATTNRSALMVMYCVDIVLYHISAATTQRQVPQVRKDRYDNAIDALKYIARGLSNPPLPPLTDAQNNIVSPARFGSIEKDQNRY
jgi:phage gp36-like protein